MEKEDKMNLSFPKSDHKKVKARNRRQVEKKRGVAKKEAKRLDGQCMNLDCPCHNDPSFTGGVFSVHHIIPLSAGGGDVVENMITFCSISHDRAENGMDLGNGKRLTGREFVLSVLRQHIGQYYWRWSDAMAYLISKIKNYKQ